MKKLLSSLVLTGLLALPVVGLAQQAPPAAPTADIMATLDSITDWLFAILLIVAAIFIIIAGYFFITAQGDPDKIAKARQFVLYALIGVLTGFAAKGLVVLISRIVVY
jgi:phosphoglycerol transferase MdoB-like AlkP superfamily enzyme